MAHADWKRYYVVCFKQPYTGKFVTTKTILSVPAIYKSRKKALEMVEIGKNIGMEMVCIARVRAPKHNPRFQDYLYNNSI